MSSKADWGKPFTVKAITREELCYLGFPRWQIAGLTDEEMSKIASAMEVSYTDHFFAEDAISAINFVLTLRGPQKPLIGEACMVGFSSQEEWMTQYLVIVLDRAELQRYLSVAEVDRLTDQDMAEIAQAMKQEIEETDFWEHCALIARCKLAEKGGIHAR